MSWKTKLIPSEHGLKHQKVNKQTEGMSAHVVDEVLVLGKFRLLVLDRDVLEGTYSKYRIGKSEYTPVVLNARPSTGTNPQNYIAIKTTESFLGATVELM